MRTKTLLLSVALGAASIAAVMAQTTPVYSVNIVGYVNKQIPAGYSLIANPLKNGNNSLGTILPTALDGTIVYKWKGTTFQDALTYLEGTWYKVNETDSDVLPPGEGAFIFIDPDLYPNGTTLTFVGEVTTGNDISQEIPLGYSIQASQVPQNVDLPSIGFPAMDGDILWFWDTAGQKYKDAVTYLEGEWYGGTAATEIATGFFVFKDVETGTQAQTWTRTFNVN